MGGRFILRNWLIGLRDFLNAKSDGVGPAALGTQEESHFESKNSVLAEFLLSWRSQTLLCEGL